VLEFVGFGAEFIGAALAKDEIGCGKFNLRRSTDSKLMQSKY
jgi:hypothetical protein